MSDQKRNDALFWASLTDEQRAILDRLAAASSYSELSEPRGLSLADFRKPCPACGTGAINQAVYPDGTFECTRCGHKRPPKAPT